MKKITFLLTLAAAFVLSPVFTSCDELLKDEIKEQTNGQEAYLPIEYANKTVAAWYMLTEQESNKTRIEAVFLFTDSTLVVTKVKIYSESDGRKPEYGITDTGGYVFLNEGDDYTNGSARVFTRSGKQFVAVIKDGKLSVPMGDEGTDVVFDKMSNSLLPKAYDPKSNDQRGDNNQGGNNNQGGDSISNSLEPFFPNEYKDKEVSAWYSYSGSDSYTDSISGQGVEIKYISSIYFFKDNSFVSTSSVLAPGPNGETVERIVSMSGRYRLEGDFTNGNLTLAFGENETISVEIRDGQFTIRDTEDGQTIVFNKQDNAAVPKASDPTQNGDWGGGDNQGGDNNQYADSIYAQLAYYPAKFAEKEVAAWYMLVDQYPEVNPVELRVEAIFLFKDNTFAVTEFKAHYGADASKPDYNLHAEGTFSVTEGDYTNGWAKISPDNGNPFDVKIVNGQLFAQNSTYNLQSTKPMVTELDDDPQGGDDNPQGGDTIISTLEPFFPTQYAGKPVSAWFTSTGTYSESGYKMDLLTAVYFFDDNSFVTAVSMIISETAGVSYERIIGGAGQYRLDGNFTAGKLAMTGPDGQAITVEINNGQFKVEENGTIDVYTIQDNASIPEPSNPTQYNDDPQGGDDDPQGGDISHITDSIYSQIAYFPTKYVDKQVNAWYVLASTEDQKIRVEAVYLFTDNTLAVTKSKYYTDGRSPEFDITAEGQYRISEGDYTTGKAMVVTADGNMFEVTIENGKLSVPMGENGANIVFNKMSNSQLPEAYNPNDNPQGGNDDPQGGDDNGGQTIQDSLLNAYAQFAFYPNAYAKKEVSAWFMLAENKENATDIRSMIFFSDNTAIITVTSIGNSYGVEQFIAMEFSYRIENNFDNGGITVIYNGQQYKASIQGGVLNADNDLYYRQSIDNLPEPSDAISDDDNPGNDDPQGGYDTPSFNTDLLVPYLPETYASKTISAIYVYVDPEEQKIKIESIILFADKTLVVTKTKVYSKEDGRQPEYGINAEGTYVLTGEFHSGTATVTLSDGATIMEVNISNSILYDNVHDMAFYFIGDEIKPIGNSDDKPIGGDDDKPIGGDDDKPIGGDDDPESGDDVTGQQTFNEDIIMPYLPEKYTDKVIAAWYVNADVQEAKIKLESVFLFDDNTLVVTKAKFYSIEDGREPEQGIIAEGTYELGRGDYNTGAATVTLSDGSTMTVMITNGVMQAMGEEFYLQSNETEIVEEGKIIGEE